MRKNDYNIFLLPSVEDIEAEAAAWLTALGREHVSERDLAEYGSWLRRSPKHREIFEKLSALWDDLEGLAELTDIAVAMPEVPVRRVKKTWLRREVFMSLAASLVLVFMGTAGYLSNQQAQLYQQATFATLVGEQQTITLSDGSVMHVNTDTKVEVDFTPGARTLTLLQGEAHFIVTKNTQRPFIVNAADGAVRAVGTAFTVRLRLNESIEVTVEEGRVALESSSESGTEILSVEAEVTPSVIAELTAGQSATFNEQVEDIQQMATVDLRRKLAWREGFLAYAGSPLTDVVADISRYTDIEIDIEDADVAAIAIGGLFRVGEVDALFDALEQTFGLQVDYITSTHVMISRHS